MAEPTEIKAFLKISKHLATGGQPLEPEFAFLQAAGYEVVVNLAPPDASNALPNEEQIVSALNMEYINIPVVWTEPEIADLQRFSSVMDAAQDKHVFVHCAANMRVSAFVYLYRTLRQKMPPTEAEEDLHQIWIPNECWSRFMEDAAKHYEQSSF